MNRSTESFANADDTRWRAHLDTLPECEPPAQLWARLQAAHAAQAAALATPALTPAIAPVRRRRTPRVWLASAAMLALAVVVAQWFAPLPENSAQMAAPGASSASSPRLVAGAAPVDIGMTDADPASRASLRRLDDALTRAYEHNADDAQLDALLQARAGVLDSLASGPSSQLVQL